MRATTTISVAAALLCASATLSGCGNDSSRTTGPTPWTFTPSDCPSDYPLPLTVSTSVDQERPYVQNVVACTSDEQYGPVYLHNVGDEVWTLDNMLVDRRYLDNTEASYAFAVTFGYAHRPLLDPDDELLVSAPPGKVSWTLDPAYTVAWDTQTEALEQLRALGAGAYLAALRRQSPQHAALAACTLAAFDAAETWTGDPDGFDENLGAALSTGSGAAGCASRWETLWATKFEPAAAFLEKADTRWRLFRTFGEHLLVFLRR